MNKSQRLLIMSLAWVVCLLGEHTTHAQDMITFVGEPCHITIPNLHQSRTLTCSARILTREGWLDQGKLNLICVATGKTQFTPVLQGLYELRCDEPTLLLRIVAINTPATINKATLLKALPRHGQQLLDGKPVTILAMGDSVTATGDYHKLLALLLTKATGNKHITVHVKAHPGRSVDASVRTYASDIKPIAPNIGLLMYGLNDQGAGGAMDVYLRQTQWLCKQLSDDFQTDMVLLQPTPHIESESTAFRTIAYAQALTDMADQLNLPVADTFNAIWGDGGNTITDSMANMRPCFPPHYRKSWETLLDTDGKGDTIHPNILGHLAMAQAVYNRITGYINPQKHLQIKAQNAWISQGMVTHLTITNPTDIPRHGVLNVYRADNWESPIASDIAYHLAPNQSQIHTIIWPDIATPHDLLTLAASGYVTHDQPYIAITDTHDGHMNVQSVQTQRSGEMYYPPQRLVTDDRSFHILRRNGFSRIIDKITLPEDQEVGVMPITAQHRNQTVVSQLSFTRFAQALVGKATVDGDLSEWAQHTWSTLGDPSQACWTRGSADNRISPSECQPRFTFKAADDGLYMAIHVEGDISRDALTVFIDPRPANQLGEPGGYYWINVGYRKDQFIATRGETSPKTVRITSAIKSQNNVSDIELFIPYALMNCDTWPTDQDMGLSLWWVHNGEQGKTHLQWSDRGHPWNTTHFGVLRRVTSPDTKLPTLVQIWP